MTSDQFVQWLNGFLDAVDGEPSPAQVASIKKKLGEVMAANASVPGAGPPPPGAFGISSRTAAAQEWPLTQSFA
jgi:hypothetical protein